MHKLLPDALTGGLPEQAQDLQQNLYMSLAKMGDVVAVLNLKDGDNVTTANSIRTVAIELLKERALRRR